MFKYPHCLSCIGYSDGSVLSLLMKIVLQMACPAALWQHFLLALLVCMLWCCEE